MTNEDEIVYMNIYNLLCWYFIDDLSKVDKWLIVENPMFGGTSALLMIFFGKGHKVFNYINNIFYDNGYYDKGY